MDPPSTRRTPVLTTTHTDRLLVHTGRSTLTLADITLAMQRWYEDAAFDAELPILWDMREATIDQRIDDLAVWVTHNLTMIGARRAGRKTAWVFGDASLAAAAVDLLDAHKWQHKVRIYHNDYEAAQAWLTTVEDAQFGYASFATSGAGFAIARVDPASAQAELFGRHTGIGWGVEDVDATYRVLASPGVEFEQVPEQQPWGGYMGIFRDPDNNRFYLDQLREH